MRISSFIKIIEDKSLAAYAVSKPAVAAAAATTKQHADKRAHAAKAAFKAYRQAVKS